VLAIREIGKSFGGIVALFSISFDVKECEIKAIIGPNGAGKSTLLNIISGIYSADIGDILFRDKLISGRPPHWIARLGISRTFQHVELFGNMTALENIMVGRHIRTHYGFLASGFRFPGVKSEEKKIKTDSLELLEYIGLSDRRDELSSGLPIGEQRILEIGRALATEPSLLLLDEPASGLNESETRQLSAFIRKLRDERGITIMIVEHDMTLVMDISDSIVVLDFGEKIAEGSPKEIRSNQHVINAYLGVEEEETADVS
jgi:branched-chain amino acid transport system ATP-binding protein